MTLNLLHLATLREFVRRGTLAEAAAARGYTPGVASQHIAALERELGTPVLVKMGRHRVLTDAGRVLAEHAEELLAAEQRARRAVTSAAGEIAGPVVLGVWGSSAAALLAPLLALAAQRHPELAITTREVSVDVATRAVRTREVDLAFGLDYPDDPLPRNAETSVRPLLRERFWVAASGDHNGSTEDGADRPPRRLAELADRAWILPTPTTVMGRALRVAFRRVDAEPNVVHEVDDTAASLQLAAQGLGLTLATDLMHSLTAGLPLTRTALRDQVFRDLVLVSPRVAPSRVIDALVTLVEEVAQGLPRHPSGDGAPF